VLEDKKSSVGGAQLFTPPMIHPTSTNPPIRTNIEVPSSHTNIYQPKKMETSLPAVAPEFDFREVTLGGTTSGTFSPALPLQSTTIIPTTLIASKATPSPGRPRISEEILRRQLGAQR